MIRQLILERQSLLNKRLEGIQTAAYNDSGGHYPSAEINQLADEMRFLADLAKAHLGDLEELVGKSSSE